MSTPSILSAIKKLLDLLTYKQKIKWLTIIVFALGTSFLEIITASVIIIFAGVLNDPSTGIKYFNNFNLTTALEPGDIVFYISIATGIIYFIKNSFAAIEVFFQNFSIQNMNYHFKNKLLNRYSIVDYNFHLTRNSALNMQIIGGDVEQIFSAGMVALANILSETIIFICLISMVLYMNFELSFIIFSIGIISCAFISKILLPKFYMWGQKLQQTGIDNHKYLVQFFHGFKEIILLGKIKNFIDLYKIHSKRKSKVQAILAATNSLPRIVIELLFVGTFILSILYLSMIYDRPSEMIGILGGYLYIGFRLMPGLNRIINQLNTFKSIIPSIERVHKEYTTIFSGNNYIDLPEFYFNEAIILNNVSFRYLNNKKDSLSNIRLKLKKGEFIGIVGETGSGKSTLVDLILGLLKPSKGTILIDNKFPANSYQWHKKIGYVPQRVYLIDDTIEANIAFGDEDIDYSALNKAIEYAQLCKFINSLPKLSKTIVGEGGIRLSGGECQRIAIARALYRNPEVLIFDEATSSLDNETEANLMKVINSISKNRTVIMIAHRLTTLKNCDQIIELKDSMIINSKQFYKDSEVCSNYE